MFNTGILFTVLSGVLFGFAPLFTRAIYSYGYSTLALGLSRCVYAIPLLFVAAKLDKESLKINRKIFFKLLLASSFSVATTFLLNYSYGKIDVSIAGTLHFMHPLFVAVITLMFYKDKIAFKDALLLLISLFGVMLLAKNSYSINLLGIASALLSSIAYASYIISIKKLSLKSLKTFTLSFYISLISSVIFLIICLLFHIEFLPKNLNVSYLMIFNSITCQFLAVTFLQIGIRHLGSRTASLLSLFEPLTISLVGIIFLNEEISTSKIIGSLIILIAVMVNIFFSKGEKNEINS